MADVLVTGGCGFIGSHLTERLLESGHRVTVLDNLSTGRLAHVEGLVPKPVVAVADVRDREALDRYIAGKKIVFHLAALVSVARSVEAPLEAHEINATGTLNVLDAARRNGVHRVILASSSAVYGSDPVLPKREEMEPQPESPYAAAKLSGEIHARLYTRLYGLETVCLRFFNVFGPRQDPSSVYSGVISRFVHCLLQGTPPTIYGDGRQSRDFVFVGDVVQAIVQAMKSERVGRGEAINVARGESITLLELIGTLHRITGTRIDPVFEPARPGDIRHSRADTTRAQRLLGFKARCGFREGLEKTVAYEKDTLPQST